MPEPMPDSVPEAGTDDCCPPPDPRIARHFDARVSRLSAEADGGFPEMVEVSRTLLALLDDVGTVQPTLLELGCGSGAMSVALLEAGAIRADGVDLSPQSVATAQRRAAAAGVADRASFVVGDGSVVPVEPHDWVVLDRVICCFSDMDGLLANSIGAASKRFAFTVPLDSGWQGLINRLFRVAENATNRLRGGPCPGYTHSIAAIRDRLRQAGFEQLRDARDGLWYATVWEKRGQGAA